MNKPKHKLEAQEPELEPGFFLASPMLRPDIVEQYGRRVARIIGDAVKGEIIVASIAWLHVSTPELAAMHEAEIITGGFSGGKRDSSPIVCNV